MSKSTTTDAKPTQQGPVTGARGRVTLKGVADQAGVSVSTASRVLSGASGISANVRTKVLLAAEQLNYATIAPAARNFTILSNMSTVHFDQIADYMHGIMLGMDAECRELGISPTIQLVGPDQLLPPIGSGGQVAPDGYALLSIFDDKLVEQLLDRGIPAIVINGVDDLMRIDAVAPANRMGGRLATDHLVKLNHKHILNLTFESRDTIRDRHHGYGDVMTNAGLEIDSSMDVHLSDMRSEVAYDAVKQRLTKGAMPDFTAIICCNDSVAIGAMTAVMEDGLRVPEDISIVGFDDIATAAMAARPLTTVQVDREAIGAFGIRRLADRVRNPKLNTTYTEFAVQLIERGSTGPASR